MIRLDYCHIEWVDNGSRIVFFDGREVSAWPHPEIPHYHVISHRCGYGDDLLAYCREHELAHVLVAQELRQWSSFVLDCQAREVTPCVGLAIMEEITAQALQRWARANERPIVADFDWDAIRHKFLYYAKQLDEEYYGS